MISFSRLKKWLTNDDGKFAVFSDADKRMYDIIGASDWFNGCISEYECVGRVWHGFIDYLDNENKIIYECKIRSNYKVDFWFILQSMIYKRFFPDYEIELVILNRKDDYKHVVIRECDFNPKHVSKAAALIKYVEDNFEKLDELLKNY